MGWLAGMVWESCILVEVVLLKGVSPIQSVRIILCSINNKTHS